MNFLSGSISGICEVLITHPIDFIKTKKQEGYSFKDNKKNYKLPDYYKGIQSRFYGIVPMRTVFWGSQDITEKYLKKNKSNIHPSYNFLIKGTVSSFFQTLIDNPIEVKKISDMAQIKSTNNFKTLYKGFNYNLIRNNIFANTFCYGTQFNSDKKYNVLLNSFFWGSLGAIASHPFDYIKTIKQSPEINDKRNFFTILNTTPFRYYTRGIISRTLFVGSTSIIGYPIFLYFNNLNINHIFDKINNKP